MAARRIFTISQLIGSERQPDERLKDMKHLNKSFTQQVTIDLFVSGRQGMVR